MNSLLRRSFALLFAAFAFAAVATADSPNLGDPAGTIIVADGLTRAEVQRGIMEVAVKEDWIVKTKADDRVVLFREQRSWVSQLTLVYDTKEIQIYSKTTSRGKPKIPEGWVKELRQEIAKTLNTKAYLK